MTNILAFSGNSRDSLSLCKIRGLVILVTMMFVLPISAFSQTDWSTEGNAVIIGKNKLGTTNDMDVVFISNNQNRLWLTNSGYFGINVYPTADLDVSGTIRFRNMPYRSAVLQSDSLGNASWGYLKLELLESNKILIQGQADSGVSLEQFLDNTDSQELSLSGTSLSISGGNTINLSQFVDNTDNQHLELAGSVLSISGGNSINFLNWDTNDADDFSGYYNDLLGLPNLFSGDYADLFGTPEFSSVAFSGNYNDLSNLPQLFDGNYSSLSGTPTQETLNYWTKLNNNLYYNIGMVGVGISSPQKQMHIHNPNSAAISDGGGTTYSFYK